MKMPVMLRSKHEEVVVNFESKLVKVYEEKARLTDRLSIANKSDEYLQNKNSELSTKLTVAEKKIGARENTIEELEKELKDARERNKNLRESWDAQATEIKDLRFCNKEAKKEINKLKSMLKVNGIAKQQLREMCLYKDGKGRYVKTENEVLVNEKVNGLKVWDLTVLLGE